MEGHFRTIRSIERTPGYLSIHSINRYGMYPPRGGEPKLPPPAYEEHVQPLRQAADSAAQWLQTVQQSSVELDRMIMRFSERNLQPSDVKDGIQSIIALVNKLHLAFNGQNGQLKPELWESIELALRHPAVRMLGLERSTTGQLCVELQTVAAKAYSALSSEGNKPLEREVQLHLKRLLLGTDGWLLALKRALAYSEQFKAIDLLSRGWLASLPHMPYIAYYSAMQAYLPIPTAGVLLNRRV